MDAKMREYQNKLKENIKILIENNKMKEAKEILRQYKEIVKDDIEIYSIEAVIEILEENFDKAEKILIDGYMIEPNNFDILYNLAYLYEVKKKFINSYNYYNKALKCNCDEIIRQQIQRKILELEINEKVNEYKQRKKVLVFAYYFPPLSGSGVQRTLKFVKYLRNFGWEPIIVTVDESQFPLKDENMINEIPDEVEIIKVKEDAIFETNSFQKIFRLYKTVVNNEKIVDEYINEINKTGNFVFIPDQNIFWAVNVIDRIANYIDFNEINIIYTTSGPYSAHIIGYYLKLHYQKPWVADFRDEWTNNPLFNISENNIIYRINYELEDSIVKFADNILTTTEMAALNYIERFSLSEYKVKTITNGYDEDDFKDITIEVNNNDKFTIFHNGIIYGNRFPISFIKAIKSLIDDNIISREEILVYFTYTDSDEEYKRLINDLGINDIVKFIGYLNHKDSLIKCSSADLLLLIIGKEDKWKSVFAGKIFEYIRMCKPILAISPNGSVTEKLIRMLDRGENYDFNDYEGIKEYILTLFKIWKEKKLPKLELNDEIMKFERKILAKNLCELYEQILEKYKTNKKIAFFSTGDDKFIWDIINQLSDEYFVTKITIKRNEDLHLIDKWIRWSDISWFEWCDQLAVYGSRLPIAKEKKIICRLHSYEAFTNNIINVNWQNIDKVIFVSESIKQIVTEKVNIEENKVEVIPNGINKKKWTFKERKKGFNIAYVGYINYKKGPMLLLHTFKAIYDQDNRYKLYIAGEFQDERYLIYFNQMVRELGLENNVIFEGWQIDLDKWLEDKNFILCTSVLESQNLSVMQAMSKGIKPIIHNFAGAKSIYDKKYLWNTINEAIEMVFSYNYNSVEYRQFIEENYSLNKYIQKIKKAIKTLFLKESVNEINFFYNHTKIKFYLPNKNDHIQKLIYTNKNFYELDMLNDIKNRIDNEGVFVDIGANIGNHSIFFSLICNAKKVYSFEPNLDVYNILSKNIEINNLKNVEIYNIGLSEKKSFGDIFIDDIKNLGMGKIVESKNGKVQLDTLDNILLNKVNTINLIKIDVEGMELSVLKGSKRILEMYKPILYIEAATEDQFQEIYEYLSQFNYRCKGVFNATPTYLFVPIK